MDESRSSSLGWRRLLAFGCLLLASLIVLAREGARDAVSAQVRPDGPVEITSGSLQGSMALDPELSKRIRSILRTQPRKWTDEASAEWRGVSALPMAELRVDRLTFELHGGSCLHGTAEVRSWRDPLFDAMTAALIARHQQWRLGEKPSAEQFREAVDREIRGN